AADAEHDVRAVLADEAPRLHQAERQAREIPNRLAETLAFQSADGDQLEREPRLRHEGLFQPALGADEYDAPRRVAREELLRDSKRRIDVPTRPPARNHQHTLHARSPSRFNSIAATDSTECRSTSGW